MFRDYDVCRAYSRPRVSGGFGIPCLHVQDFVFPDPCKSGFCPKPLDKSFSCKLMGKTGHVSGSRGLCS